LRLQLEVELEKSRHSLFRGDSQAIHRQCLFFLAFDAAKGSVAMHATDESNMKINQNAAPCRGACGYLRRRDRFRVLRV
jgi:hypothetical protein